MNVTFTIHAIDRLLDRHGLDLRKDPEVAEWLADRIVEGWMARVRHGGGGAWRLRVTAPDGRRVALLIGDLGEVITTLPARGAGEGRSRKFGKGSQSDRLKPRLRKVEPDDDEEFLTQ